MTATRLEYEPSLPMVGRAHLQQRADVIRREYLELPGLSLTTAQVQRLWNLDRNTCQGLLDVLVRDKFLRQTADAQYVRTDWCRRFDACD